MPDKPSRKMPAQKRKVYSTAEIEHALGAARTLLHPDGTINWTRASRQLGIAVNTLKKWDADPGQFGVNDDSVTTIKNEIRESYLDKAKRAREVFLDRMIAVAGSEADLFKLSGAFKTVSEAASAEEVNHAVAIRIRGHRAVPDPAPAAGPDPPGGHRGPDPGLN